MCPSRLFLKRETGTYRNGIKFINITEHKNLLKKVRKKMLTERKKLDYSDQIRSVFYTFTYIIKFWISLFFVASPGIF